MITSKDISRICGVSLGTVDRALNGRPGISQKTKEKILKVSRELGYRPHLAARSLKTGKNWTIGVVLFDLDNHYFAQVLNSLVLCAHEEGYFLHLTLSEHKAERELECLHHLVSLPVDGLIIFPINKGAEFTRFTRLLNVPLVTLGNRVSASIPFVSIDDKLAMGNCVEYLVGKGYRRIIYFSPPLVYRGKENTYAVSERYMGYRHGMKLAGLEPVVLNEKHPKSKILELTKTTGEKTAVLCSSDIYALETLSILREAGVRVPEDVGVMGFDDIDFLSHTSPPLSSVSQNIDLLARTCFKVLKDLMEGKPDVPQVTLTDHRIVQRSSV